MNYIMCTGGLGNQMFQYAFFYVAKKKYHDLAFDISYFDTNKCHNGFELSRCFGVEDYVNERKNAIGLNRIKLRVCCMLNIGHFLNIKRERVNDYITNICWEKSIIYGYWQSADFFIENKDEIQMVFRFKGISERNYRLAEIMRSEDSVAIHVRRGDYLSASHYYDLSESEYYSNSLKYLSTLSEQFKYYVFSDDIKWCKTSGLFSKNAVYVDWNTGESSYEDMFLISNAKYCITANSTFSWWAAFLGNHKIVIRPSKYKDDWDAKKISSFFPDDWITIEV